MDRPAVPRASGKFDRNRAASSDRLSSACKTREPMVSDSGMLWHWLRARPASESGRLRHGVRGQGPATPPNGVDVGYPLFDQGTFQALMFDRVIPLADGRRVDEQVARGEARGQLVLVL